ncbi:MAG: chorismate lyase [Gammaproteobacteria bacterium]|nr:chorismate lyase [Gammaproteobacteria bacterium]
MTDWKTEYWRNGASIEHCAIPAALRSWLLERGSLTRKLRAHCAGRVSVRVTAHAWGRITRAERQALDMDLRVRGFVRQVELSCADRVVIFARTVLPPATVAARRHLTRLGNRALGDVLFADRRVQRGAVRVARLPQGIPVTWPTGTIEGPLWGRRSLFMSGAAPLLVSEYFLSVP